MTPVLLTDPAPRPLVFYLAMEEYLGSRLHALLPAGSREAFFLWKVPPTVIFGRNQVLEAEVNTAYCQAHGVQLYRRKSGGGCVYADRGNLMLSFLSVDTDVPGTFAACIERMADALRGLGLDAVRSGRNDVLVGGRKVSGNAFFRLPDASIVHGTLLYDVDFAAMEAALTPSQTKLQGKGVASVRQHVVNLREALEQAGRPMPMEAVETYLAERFSAGAQPLVLSQEQIAEIEKIEQGYLQPDFLYGRHRSFPLVRRGRVPGAGEITLSLDVEDGRVDACSLSGDFFPLSTGLDVRLSRLLRGCPFRRDAVREALSTLRLEEEVMGLTTVKLLDILFENNDNQ